MQEQNDIKFFNNISISLDDFYYWLNKNWNDFEKLQNGKHSDSSLIKKAVEIFLSFQSFYQIFLNNGIDRTPLFKTYHLWHLTIKQYIKQYKHLGDFEYIEDTEHLKQLLEISNKIKKDIYEEKKDTYKKHISTKMIFDAWEEQSTLIDNRLNFKEKNTIMINKG
jgi:hypothetical protein